VGFFGVRGAGVLEALIGVSGSRWDIRWLSGGGKTWFFVYLAWRLWKSVVTLAVRGNSISGGVVRRQRVPVF
jgi:hypothetical protein